MSIPSKISLQKRKRDDDTTKHELDARPFAIKPPGNDPFAKTKSFTPVCVLDRAQLPLAWIDAAGAGSQLFAAYVRVLEAYAESGEDGKVLVVAYTDGGGTGRLFAVERSAKRIYAICRLGSWVGREVVERLAGQKEAASVKRRAIGREVGGPWWKHAAVNDAVCTDAVRGEGGEVPMLCMQESRSEMQSTSAPAVDHAVSEAVPLERGDYYTESEGLLNPGEDAIPHDPLEALAKQYLDALYLSRTSLAYFAKGPLSRARAAFSGAAGAEDDVTQLLAFLRDALLPASISDQKDKRYKIKLPGIIKELPVGSPEKPGPSKSRKKKNTWKPRRDKAGFLPNERECLETWWRNDVSPTHLTSPEPQDVAIKRRLKVLRSRETYLQTIIILEILALEAQNSIDYQAITKPPLLTAESQDVESQDLDSQTLTEPKLSKSKKPQDLHKILETLLERLNIAHCADFIAPTPLPNTDGDTTKDESSDELKSFCIDVIIPFYMSRLPKEAALVNKQLGGPSPPSPAKRQNTTSRSTITRPGQAAVRKPPERKPREPVTRVRTETLNASLHTAPGLSRSASDHLLLNIKREPSESATPLSAIPARRVRVDRLQELSQSHRTVNLEAKAKAAEAKRLKNVETESQIREALAAVRKPNRELANREAAERADERFRQVTAKPQRPSRPSLPTVAATPKRPTGPAFVPASVLPATRDAVAPSTSARYVPASLSHVSDTPALARSNSLMESTRVDDSPVKKPAFLASLPESPTFRRKTKTMVASTPVKKTRSQVPDTGTVSETPRRSDAVGKLSWFPRERDQEQSRRDRLVAATPVKGGR